MTNQQKTRLLVVEDDGLIRLDLVDTLEDMGFDVIDAANADEALKIIETTDGISAVLTDIDMPGSMNGVVFANVVYGRWPHCRIIVISGRYRPEQGTLPPDACFIVKPVSDRHLTTVLRDMNITPQALP